MQRTGLFQQGVHAAHRGVERLVFLELPDGVGQTEPSVHRFVQDFAEADRSVTTILLPADY